MKGTLKAPWSSNRRDFVDCPGVKDDIEVSGLEELDTVTQWGISHYLRAQPEFFAGRLCGNATSLMHS